MTSTARPALDPLWQALCPAWTTAPPSFLRRARLPPRLQKPSSQQCRRTLTTNSAATRRERQQRDAPGFVVNPLVQPEAKPLRLWQVHGDHHKLWQWKHKINLYPASLDIPSQTTSTLYTHLRTAATGAKTLECRRIAEALVRDRGERPSQAIYHALILSNVNNLQGAAWRVGDLLDEMDSMGIAPDLATCHAVLKVLAVHPDHLMRADMMDYMRSKWFSLTDEGRHDVAAGMLRSGLFEQGMDQLDQMRQEGIAVAPWLWEIAQYVLLEAGEIDEAHRIMRMRLDDRDLLISRALWWTMLDKASAMRHYDATDLAWASQVTTGYQNPSSGTCLNVLATAAQKGDAIMATEVFSQLSKRGSPFQAIHYELLINAYMHPSQLDLRRALTILTVMASEKLEPTAGMTRQLYAYLRDRPEALPGALEILRELHAEHRTIPLAALNLLIECHTDQNNLDEAIKLYKQIHTFVHAAEGAKKSFADAETFNHLFKACRNANPPDARTAAFLVSELLALGVVPTALTYDRLILVFLAASEYGHRAERRKAAMAVGGDETSSSATTPTTTDSRAAGSRDGTRAASTYLPSANLPPNTDRPEEHGDDPTQPSTTTSRPYGPTPRPDLHEFYPGMEINPSKSHEDPDQMLDFAFRHFDDMLRMQNWLPRFGTLRNLAVQLAAAGDDRCWEVMQAGEDNSRRISGWRQLKTRARLMVEEAWRLGQEGSAGAGFDVEGMDWGLDREGSAAEDDGSAVGMYDDAGAGGFADLHAGHTDYETQSYAGSQIIGEGSAERPDRAALHDTAEDEEDSAYDLAELYVELANNEPKRPVPRPDRTYSNDTLEKGPPYDLTRQNVEQYVEQVSSGAASTAEDAESPVGASSNETAGESPSSDLTTEQHVEQNAEQVSDDAESSAENSDRAFPNDPTEEHSANGPAEPNVSEVRNALHDSAERSTEAAPSGTPEEHVEEVDSGAESSTEDPIQTSSNEIVNRDSTDDLKNDLSPRSSDQASSNDTAEGSPAAEEGRTTEDSPVDEEGPAADESLTHDPAVRNSDEVTNKADESAGIPDRAPSSSSSPPSTGFTEDGSDRDPAIQYMEEFERVDAEPYADGRNGEADPAARSSNDEKADADAEKERAARRGGG